MTILGIDIGFKGGLAFYQPETKEFSTTTMPIIGSGKDRELDLSDLTDWITDSELVVAEKVHAMPEQGVSSSFRFGEQLGLIRGICFAKKVPLILVTPQRWKKIVLAGYNWKGNKSMAVKFVQQRYPSVDLLATVKCKKPHDGIADAVCLAEYGRINNSTTQE